MTTTTGTGCALALVLASAMTIAQGPSSSVNPGVVQFVTGPPDGAARALAAGQRMPDAGPSSELRVSGPLAIYLLELTELARGKGPDAARFCGYQYQIETRVRAAQDGGGLAPHARRVGTVELDLEAFCASRVQLLAGQNRATLEAAWFDVQDPRLRGDVHEPRLLLVTDLQPVPARSTTAIGVLWLKSKTTGAGRIHPTGLPSRRLDLTFVTPDQFVRGLQPWSSDGEMHDYFAERFVKVDGLGGSRMASPVMTTDGAMRLHTRAAGQDVADERYVLDAVELIGIARHESPVAFVKTFHAIQTRTMLNTRTLTDVEQESLHTLRAGKDVVVHRDRAARQVVGAIRARGECLQCHAGYKVGDVLGALTYRLSAVDP